MAKQNMFKNTLLVLSFLCSASAMAGVVFVPRATGHPDAADNEDFPESHFGSGGFGDGFAASQVNDMEAPDEETGKTAQASRGLASVGDNPNSGSVVEKAIVTSQAAASQDIPESIVARKGVQEVSVIASDLGYFPKTVFVSRDVPVRMFVTSASKNTLCIMMDSFQVRKQLTSKKIEEITFIPNVPGTYRFYCPVNGMEGNLVVREFSSNVAQEETAPQPQTAAQSEAHRFPAATRNVPVVSEGWHSALDTSGN